MKFGTGSLPVMLDTEEEAIMFWIVESLKRGAPQSSLDVLDAANKIIQMRLGIRRWSQY
jgi:hypothetical protein